MNAKIVEYYSLKDYHICFYISISISLYICIVVPYEGNLQKGK